jgi:hypothetical protein
MRCGHLDPSIIIVSRERYEHLKRHYFSPVDGIRDLAADLLVEQGHDPDDPRHGKLLDAMSEEMAAALIEAGSEIMREYGLKDLRVEPSGKERRS